MVKSPENSRRGIARTLAVSLAFASVLGALSCGREVTGPAAFGRLGQTLAIVPEFRAMPGAARVESGVAFARVRLLLQRSSGVPAVDTLIDFPAGVDSVTLALTPRLADISSTGETMLLFLRFITAAGDTVFRSGPDTVLVRPASAGAPPAAVAVTPIYVGPGAEAVRVVIAPTSTLITGGQALGFTAQAFNAQSVLVPAAPILFTSSDTTRVRFANARSGNATTFAQRGTVRVYASLLGGGSDSADVAIALPASAIATRSGDAQVGIASAPLAQPVRVRVTASDAVAVAGVSVTFTAANGGSVGAATVVTDANGEAGTTWTLGPLAGPQSLSAAATGLTGSPVGFTATATAATATTLSFTVQPASGLAAAPIAPAIQVTARDAGGNIATGFTGNVTVALGTNPAAATLGGTLSVPAVAGVATFGDLTVDQVATGYTLVASAPGLAGATSAPFNASLPVNAWTNTSGGVWTAAANWSLGRAPLPIDSVIIAAPGTYSVQLDVPFTGRTIVLGGGAGVQTLAAASQPISLSNGMRVLPSGALELNGTSNITGIVQSGGAIRASGDHSFVTGLSVAAGGSLQIAASTLSATNSRVQVAGGFTNAGTITLTNGASAGAFAATLEVTGGALVNAASGSVVVSSGALGGGARSIVAAVVNQGALSLFPGETGILGIVGDLTNSGTVGLEIAGATSLDQVIVTGAVTLGGTLSVGLLGGYVPAVGASFTMLTHTGARTGTFATASLAPPLLSAPTYAANAVVVSTPTYGPATQLAFTTQPVSGVAATPLAPVVVTARDAGGATDLGYNGPVTIALGTNPTGAALSGTLTVNAVAGVATFTSLTVSLGGAGYTLDASSGGLSGATSTSFNLSGAVIRWASAVSGNWSVPANWNLGRLPQATDSVVVDAAGTYTVTVDVNFSGTSVTVGGATGAQTLAFANRTITVSGQLRTQGTGVVSLQGSTVNGALVNAGRVVVNELSALTGAVTNSVGGVLQIGGATTTSTAQLTVATGLTNAGTIELTNGTAGVRNASVIVTSGTLVNAPGATIVALQGTVAGGSRTLTGVIDNQGLLRAEVPLTLSGASGTSTNSGTVSVVNAGTVTVTGGIGLTNTGTVSLAAGRRWTQTGGTFTQAAGATLSGGGVMVLTTVTAGFATATGLDSLILAQSTVSGAGTVTNAAGTTLVLTSTTVNSALVNAGRVVVNELSALTGAVTNSVGGVLQIGGATTTSTAQLTVATGLTNAGTIELTNGTAGVRNASVIVTSGTLVNAPGATIVALQGTVAGGSRTLTGVFDNQGLLRAEVPLTLSGASGTSTNSGTVSVVNTGTVTVTGGIGLTNTGTVSVGAGRRWTQTGGTFTQAAGATLGGGGVMSLTSVTAGFATATALDSLILAQSTVSGAGTVTNAVGTTLVLTSTTVSSALVNAGRVVVNDLSALTGAVTNGAGAVLQIGGATTTSTAQLTVATGLTNAGTIELTNGTAGVRNASVIVTSGTLVNAPGGTIVALQGTVAGGARTLTGVIDNQGLLRAEVPLTLSGATGTSTNSGTLAVVNIGTVTVTGGIGLTNTGTVSVGAGRRWTQTGGTFTQAAGATLGGGGVMSLTSVTAGFATATALDSLILGQSTVSGAGTVTNAVGATLVLTSTTVNSALVNAGRLVVNDLSALTGAVTNSVGAVLQIGGATTTSTAQLTVANGFTNAGTIELTNGTGGLRNASLIVTSGTLTNAPGGTIVSLIGSAAGGTRSITAALVDNQGTLAVAPGAAQLLTINGALSTSGTVGLDIGGLVAGSSFSRISVSGTLNVGGTLNVALFGGFVPVAGNTFTVLTNTGARTGTFAAASLPAPLSATPTYAANAISVDVPAAGAADNAAFTTQPSAATAGAVIVPPVVVAVRDAGGTTVPSYTGAVTIALVNNPGGATLTGTATVNAVAGVATFNDLSVSAAGLAYTLGASAAGLTGATSAPFNVSAQEIRWVNPVSGNWLTSANWDLARAPVATDSVIIDAAGTYTVTMDASFTGTHITLGGATGTQTLAMNGRTVALSGQLRALATGAVSIVSSTLSGGGSLRSSGTVTLRSSSLGLALVNEGTVLVEGTSTLPGALTTVAGSVLRMQGTSVAGPGVLTVATGFTNVGTIELTNNFSSQGAALTVTSGTLVNAPTGTIGALPGVSGGARGLNATLDNQGTLTATTALTVTTPANGASSNTGSVTTTGAALTLSQSAAGATFTNGGTLAVAGGDFVINQNTGTQAFTNTGTLTVGAGQSLRVTFGTFTQAVGATLTLGDSLVAGSGTLVLNAPVTVPAMRFASQTVTLGAGVSLPAGLGASLTSTTLTGSTPFTVVSGQTLLLRSSSWGLPLVNEGTVLVEGTSTLPGALTTVAGSVLRMQGTSVAGPGVLTVANGFTNVGTIELTNNFSSQGAALTVTSGTLVNAPTGTVLALPGVSGGARGLNATLDNQGTLAATTALTVTTPANGASSNTGSLTMTGAALTLVQSAAAATFTNGGTLGVTGGDLVLTQNTGTQAFTNTGTLTVGAGQSLRVTFGTFTQAVGATLTLGDSLVAGSGTLVLNAPVTVPAMRFASQTVTLGAGVSLPAGLGASLTSTTLTGSTPFTVVSGQTLLLRSSSWGLPLVNEGTVLVEGTSTLPGALTTVAGSVLRMQGTSGLGTGFLTVANGFTNLGTLELTNTTGGGQPAALTVTSGTLVNAPTGTIRALPGVSGGARTLTATLDNQGTLSIAPGAAAALTIAGALNSSGTISLDLGGLTAGSTFGQLNVNGALTLDGTLNVGLFGGFVPVSGNTFTVVNNTGARTGTFATTNLAAPLTPNPLYNPNSIVVSVP